MKTKLESIKWFIPLELNHSSYIYSSVNSFCKKNGVKFKLSYKNLNRRGRIDTSKFNINYSPNWYAKVTFFLLVFENKTSKLIAFDLNDSSTYFPSEALNIADLIFKRCYQKKYVDVLPIEYKCKVKPMGLPFMVRPNILTHKYKLLVLFLCFKFKELIKLDRLLFKRLTIWLNSYYLHWRKFVKTRTVQDFYCFDKEGLTNKIFYQKRLFPNENDIDTKNVHLQRALIVRLLKKEFPNIFKGGLKANEIVNKHYSDCISNIDGNPIIFLEEMRRCGICIYTRGLVDSPGWTLPEFLSQGKCIVAEKLEVELPFPLKNNVHALFFESNEELIEICKRLISDVSEINRIGKNAREYYENHIAPSIFIQNILNQV